ncbi:MAG TPA: hypothetical protein VGO11_24580 [Chthoniobacteraceae bacterium]|jgi:hypothetical protein|nr:hypothetical protein [Chthoniobacteraceae bacterium]
MRALLPSVLVVGLALGSLRAADAPPADPRQAPFAILSGQELVRMLPQEKSRLRAYYELWRRSHEEEDDGLEEFEEDHYDLNVIECPQGEGKPPVYVILHGFLGSEPGEPPKKPPTFADRLVPRKAMEAIDVITADGRLVDPFGGNNVLDGVMTDLNGDGLIDRAEVTNYGIDGVDHVQVLSVGTVGEKAQPLLDILLNWDNDEWTWRLTDADGDGVADIEAGPRTAKGMVTKAVWKWDRLSHAYVGPKGGPNDHFRVLDGTKLWPELQRLQQADLRLPHDLDGVAEADLPPPPPPEEAPAAPPRLVDREKDEPETPGRPPRSALPKDFWSTDAKTAALAMLNGTSRRFRYEEGDDAKPPASCSIAFEVVAAGCFGGSDAQCFLRVDPQESYLAFGRTSMGGETFYHPLRGRPTEDLRYAPLPYEDARQIADVIWWLEKARGRSNRGGGMFSTSDGQGRLAFRAGGRLVFEHAQTTWSTLDEDRRRTAERPELAFNCAAYLLAHAVPERLGKAWEPPIEPRMKDLQELGERFLSWYSPGQEKISFALVADAAELIGAGGSATAQEKLKAIVKALPPPDAPRRTFEQISADLTQVLQPIGVVIRAQRRGLQERRRALEEEMQASMHDPRTGSADRLRTTTTVALRQIALAQDGARLLVWASSKEAGAAWALRRLEEIDRPRYVEALVAWARGTDWPRDMFDKLAEVDPARATTLARELPPEERSALTIPAFLQLRAAGPVPDEAKRMATITQILHDPKVDFEERIRAVDALVPPEAPLRYPGREVDTALLKLFEPGQADASVNFTLTRASRALALRGCTDAFDRMVEQLETTKDTFVFAGVLGAAVQLAQTDPARFNPRLQALLQPHLISTDVEVPPILRAIWAADLRGLRPDLERIATRGAEEAEDPRAASYSSARGPITGRFHLARRIVELWSENDPPARARLLVAFAFTDERNLVREPVPERVAQMKLQLLATAAELTPAGRKELGAWLDGLDAQPPEIVPREICRKVTALVREVMKL